MKINTPLLVVAASFLAFSHVQAAVTFTSTGIKYPVPAGITVKDNANGVELAPFASAPNLQMTTNLIIDADSLTARFSGSTSGTSATFSYTTGTFNQQIGTANNFPNPPTPIFADGFASISVTLTINPGTFDSGTRSMVWNGSTYVINYQSPVLGTIQGNAEITFSITSEGQTTTITQNRAFTTDFVSTGELDLTNYPSTASTNLRFTGGNIEGMISGSAPNGFAASLYVIPEPSSSLLLGAGSFVLLMSRKRRLR